MEALARDLVKAGDRTVLDQEVKDTKTAMSLLEAVMPKVFLDVSPNIQARFDNALLNMAVNRIIAAEGHERTAAILIRLADAMVSRQLPTAERPIDLTRLDG